MNNYKDTRLSVKFWKMKMQLQTNDWFVKFCAGFFLICAGVGIILHCIAPNGFF